MSTLVQVGTVPLFTAIRRFALHYLEMCVAMCMGGAPLVFAAFSAASLAGTDLLTQAPELSIALIAGIDALVMAVYMALRRHPVRHNIEMSGSTLLGAIPLIGVYWLGWIPEARFDSWIRLFSFVCTPLCGLMLAVMLARFEHYGGRVGGNGAVTVAAAVGEYTCPMHPEVRSTEPGRCPICEMRLTRRGS